jgi:hypothetical protein
MTTATDGILRSKNAKSVFTILEAKKMLRERNSNEIKIQETAKMVGWINEHGDRSTSVNG